MKGDVGLLLFFAACILYGIGSSFGVELGQGRRISPRTTVGVVLICLSAFARSPESMVILLAAGGGLCSAVVKVVRGQFNRIISWEVLALLIASFISVALMKSVLDSPPKGLEVVLLVTAVSIPFLVLDRAVATFDESSSRGRVTAVRDWLVVQLMLMSLAAMTMLTATTLRWGSLMLLLLIFAVARAEFQRLAEAERTYSQSVAALGRLMEKAGYVRPGYHDAVEGTLSELVQQLRLKREMVLHLSFGAIAYSAGWVALGDPEDLANLSRSELRAAGIAALRAGPAERFGASKRSNHELVVQIVPLVSEIVRYGSLGGAASDSDGESKTLASARKFLANLRA